MNVIGTELGMGLSPIAVILMPLLWVQRGLNVRKPEPNPDRIKWDNDQRQKKLTIRHFEQKIENERTYLKQEKAWLERDKKRVFETEVKLAKMEEELMRMKLGRNAC